MESRIRCCTALTVLILGCGVVTPAAASPGWVAQGNLSNPQTEVASSPDVALDGRGDAEVAWVDSVGSVADLLASARPAGGIWRTPSQLSGLLANFDELRGIGPQIVDDGQGDLAAVWARDVDASHTSVEVSVRPQGGSWSPPEHVSPTDGQASGPAIAISASGQVIVAWNQDGTINARVRGASGAWSAPVPLGAGSRPAVAINQDGDMVTVWENVGQSSQVVMASVRLGAGDWGLPRTLASYPLGGDFLDLPQVALDRDGEATAAWDLYPAELVEAATRPPGGSWGPPVTLTHSGEFPGVAYDGHGNVTVIWTNDLGIVQTLSRPAGGSWLSTPITLGLGSAARPALAVNASGDAIAAWCRRIGGGEGVYAAIGTSTGTWGAPAQLRLDTGESRSVATAIDDAGDALVVWSSADVVAAAAYDRTGPRLDSLSVPATGVAGSSVRFGVVPLDTWGAAASPHWDFGDGTSDSGPSPRTHMRVPAGTRSVSHRATRWAISRRPSR